MAQKVQGVGSIWNPNSWHWYFYTLTHAAIREEKDYTPLAKKLLTDRIKACKVNWGDILLINTEIKSIKGDVFILLFDYSYQAQVNIRKGKQILNYDFEIEVDWQADDDDNEAEGSYTIVDFTSLDPEFEFKDLSVKKNTKISSKAIEIVKNQMIPKLRETLSTF